MQNSGERRLLLVAATTGYQLRRFTAEAVRIGVQPVLATDRCHVLDDPWADSAIPVKFEEAENSAAEVAEALAAAPVQGVIAVGDRATLVAALAAVHLNLPFHSPSGALAASDKYLTRERFRSAGLPVPAFARLGAEAADPPEPPSIPFPVVLKPLHLSASQGVIRADTDDEFAAAYRRIRNLLLTPKISHAAAGRPPAIQVEQYIPGRELALEGLVTGGRFRTLAVFDKPEPLTGPYFEETLYVAPSREPGGALAAVEQAAARAAEALGLRHGPVHAEMRVNGEGVWMLEVAGRPIGGLCARALQFDGGESLEGLLIRHALGEDVSAVKPLPGAFGVLMMPVERGGIFQGASGVEEARSVAGIEDIVITAVKGQEMQPWPEGASYLGFAFARASRPDAVEQALKTAQSKIRFQFQAALPVVAGRPAAS